MIEDRQDYADRLVETANVGTANGVLLRNMGNLCLSEGADWSGGTKLLGTQAYCRVLVCPGERAVSGVPL